MRGRLSLIERLGLLLDRRLRLARAGRLLLGGAGNLLGALLRFGGRALGFERGGQHLLAAFGDPPHVLAQRIEGLDDGGAGLGFVDGRLGRLLHRVDDAANSV